MRIIAMLLCFCIVTPVIAEENAKMRLITVTGNGAVESVPDMATVTMGVISEGKTGALAMRKNTADLNRMMQELRRSGIEARDVQTSNLSLSPRWDNRSQSNGENPKIIGFTAQNTVTVRIRDMDKLGEILDAVVQNGANNFHGLSFGVQHLRPMQDQARIKAVKDAISKAKLLTSAAGLTLGDVISITEAGRGPARPVMMNDMAMARSAVPVAAGEVSVGLSVTMVFEIR